MGRVTPRQNCGPDPTHTRAAWPPWRAASSRRVPTRWRPPRGRCRSPPVAGCPRWAAESQTATCWPPVPCNDNKNNLKMHFGYFFLQPAACKVWLLIKFRFGACLSVRFLLIFAFKNLIRVMVPTGNVASATKGLYFSTSEVIQHVGPLPFLIKQQSNIDGKTICKGKRVKTLLWLISYGRRAWILLWQWHPWYMKFWKIIWFVALIW